MNALIPVCISLYFLIAFITFMYQMNVNLENIDMVVILRRTIFWPIYFLATLIDFDMYSEK